MASGDPVAGNTYLHTGDVWVGDQGEGTFPGCTLYFSDFRTSFSFSLWLGEWDHFTRRTETFQKISNMYGYLFVHNIAWIFQWILSGEGRGNDETVSTGCGSPSVLHPGCYCYYARDSFVDSPSVLRPGWHIQETALWIPRGAFCPLEGGRRHIGTDTLAPVLQWHQLYNGLPEHCDFFLVFTRIQSNCFPTIFLRVRGTLFLCVAAAEEVHGRVLIYW